MARDTLPPVTIADRLAALRSRMIDPTGPARLKALRKAVSGAIEDRTLAAAAAQAGALDAADELASAKAAEKSARSAVLRAQQAPHDAVTAALPDLAAIARQLATDAAALAALLRDAESHLGGMSANRHPVLSTWATADASSRGLGVVADTLAPPARGKPATWTLRWSKDAL